MISVIVGPEVITGSTRMKAGTATKLILNMISTTLMIKQNKTYSNLMVDLNATNTKLRDRAVRIISQITLLNYKKSIDLLKSAKGEVKVAILMFNNQCSYKESIKKLQKFHGSLRDALDNS